MIAPLCQNNKQVFHNTEKRTSGFLKGIIGEKLEKKRKFKIKNIQA